MSQVSNLDPFPDGFHYIWPAKNFLAGYGLRLGFPEGGFIAPSVPPLMSLYLVPFYFLDGRAQTFFFANLVSMSLSFLLFLSILQELKINRRIQLFSLGLFALHPAVIHYVRFPMAEHLVLVQVLFLIWLFVRPSRWQSALLAGLVAPAIYVTKYAFWPVSAVFLLFFLVQFLRSEKRWSQLLAFIMGGLTTAGLFFTWELTIRGESTLKAFVALAAHLQRLLLPTVKETVPVERAQQSAAFFSERFFPIHFPAYCLTFFGQGVALLWERFAVSTPVLGLLTIVLSVRSLLTRERQLVALLLSLIVAQFAFISFFYTLDLRYIFHVIPVFYLLFAIALANLPRWITARATTLVWMIVVGSVVIQASFGLPDFKTRFLARWRQAETSWNLISVQEMDAYFAAHPTEKQRYVVTVHSPLYVQLFAREQYRLLWLSPTQDFAERRAVYPWGPGMQQQTAVRVEQLLTEGNEVYLSTAALGYIRGDEGGRRLEKLQQQFSAKRVAEGCLGTCELYELQLP